MQQGFLSSHPRAANPSQLIDRPGVAAKQSYLMFGFCQIIYHHNTGKSTNHNRSIQHQITLQLSEIRLYNSARYKSFHTSRHNNNRSYLQVITTSCSHSGAVTTAHALHRYRNTAA